MMKKTQMRKSLQRKIGFNHVYELYEESGSDNDNIEDSLKGENEMNSKEEGYTNMDEKKEGK